MPINSSILLTSMDERGVMTLTLNRPDAFNAMSEALLEALQASITQMSEDPNLRCGRSLQTPITATYLHAAARS